MKKQILFLAIFSLAIFAGTTTVYGQVLNPSPFAPATVPRLTPNCTGDPLHPKAGIPYIYQFEEGTSATSFRFWATKNPNFVTGAFPAPTVTNQTDSLGKTPAKNQLINYSPNYLSTGVNQDSVEITWNATILAATDFQGSTAAWATASPTTPSPTFVVGWGTAVGCTDNIKIWEIDPTPSFTVDITNIAATTMLPLAYGATTTQCVDEVRSARYNAGVVDYNFGWDTLYYEVVAANFVTSWLPTFQLTGLQGDQTAAIGWASTLSNARKGTFIEPAALPIANATNVPGTVALTSGVPNTTTGVSLFVRVVIANNTTETATGPATIGLAVAGTDLLGLDITDNGTTCEIPATIDIALADDISNRTIDPRPSLTGQAPSAPVLGIGALATP